LNSKIGFQTAKTTYDKREKDVKKFFGK